MQTWCPVPNTRGLLLRDCPRIGNGLRVATATNENQGLGLFSDIFFNPGDVVTFYAGLCCFREDVFLQSMDLRPTNHTITVGHTEFAIQGFQIPLPRAGGGSFCNHRARGEANCKYNTLDPTQHSIEYSIQPFIFPLRRLPLVIIEAIEHINPGSELMCNYGARTCAELGIPYR